MDETIKVLIIEDNRYARETIKNELSDLNYYFVEATSGEQALALINRQSFDAIILDIGLPGISGLEVLSGAKEVAPDLAPVIVLTGHLDSSIEKEAQRIGVFAYLTKAPLQIDELRHFIIEATS